MKVKLITLAAVLIVGLASACSSGSEAPTEGLDPSPTIGDSTSVPATSYFESCSGLLELDEVRDSAGRSDVEIGEPNVNSGPAPTNDVGMETICIYEYVTPEILVGGPTQARLSGPSMTLTGILFDSGETAAAHYEFTLTNIRMMKDATSTIANIAEGELGDASYALTVDAEGIGSMFGVRVGPYMIALHTTLPDGEDPLVGPQGFKALSKLAQERLVSP